MKYFPEISPFLSRALQIILVSVMLTEAASKEGNITSISISRKHMILWFDHSVRYYDHEADNAYTKDDLKAMVNVVSKRFSKLAIDVAPTLDNLPPGNESHSRIWIPEVVATHNRQQAATSPAMEVVVSYDVSKIARTTEVTSFDVAKYMADKANSIYPGTVKTLMMYTGFSIFSAYYSTKDTVQQLKIVREKTGGGNGTANSTSFKYDLAVFLDLKDCGHFKGSLGQKAKDFLPHVDIIVTLLRPNYHQMSFNAEILHKMFVTKFEDCERKLKREKPNIRVIPSVLWMAKKGSVGGMAQAWQLISDWSKKKDIEVIMFEAFDTPHGHLISDQGWWRLKDKAEHEIKEDSFVEKVFDKSSKKDAAGNLAPSWDDSDETDSESSASLASASVMTNATHENSANALYIVLVLLSVVCFLLVAVIVGLVYGFRTMTLASSTGSRASSSMLNASPSSSIATRIFPCNEQHSSSFQDSLSRHEENMQGQASSYNNGMMDGSQLEIRDTTPIFAVTYKK